MREQNPEKWAELVENKIKNAKTAKARAKWEAIRESDKRLAAAEYRSKRSSDLFFASVFCPELLGDKTTEELFVWYDEEYKKYQEREELRNSSIEVEFTDVTNRRLLPAGPGAVVVEAPVQDNWDGKAADIVDVEWTEITDATTPSAPGEQVQEETTVAALETTAEVAASTGLTAGQIRYRANKLGQVSTKEKRRVLCKDGKYRTVTCRVFSSSEKAAITGYVPKRVRK